MVRAAALALLLAGSQMTVSDLQTLCGERQPGEACRFYILGVMEGTSLAAASAKDKAHFCTPPGVVQSDIVAVVKRIVTADLVRFPADAKEPAVSFVGAALQLTYPCKKN